MSQENGRHTYRLPPCPAYDVEGMERWLSGLAQEGLFLARDGFFCGIATLERGEPRFVKYRLEAAQKSTSMWAEDGGEPDPEQVELSRHYAWDYVANRGDFYIYRSFEPGARELNTDPEVQALALDAVKKRRAGEVLQLLIWITLYAVCALHGLLLTIIGVRTWFFLLAAGLVLWVAADSAAAFFHLGRLQKKLRAGLPLDTGTGRKSRTLRYHGRNILQIALGLALVCIFLHNWSASFLDEDKVPLGEYTGELPFAAMMDFAGEEKDYRRTMTGMGFNYIREWSDWLAPRCIEYAEHARVTLSDGRVLDGGLYIDYYETISHSLAKTLAKEWLRADRSEKNFELMKTPELGADYTAAYYNNIHFPTIILQKGTVAVRASFYQTSENYTMDFEAWTALIADSIGG